MNFTEPSVFQVDNALGMGRISYYSGMDTYIFNNDENGTAYSIFPVIDKMSCFESPASGIPLIFPNLTRFTKAPRTEVITTKAYPDGVLCDVWELLAGGETPDETGNATAWLPTDEAGYAGNYTFYVHAVDGVPVQFVTTPGHNIVLGASHVDVYKLDYLRVTEMAAFSEFVFRPPYGEQCKSNSNPFGPVRGDDVIHRHDPKDHFAMLFPEGAEQREATFQEYTNTHGKVYEGHEYHARKNIFHHNLRYISAANRRGRPYVLAANHMADWTDKERAMLRGKAPVVEVEDDDFDPNEACGVMQMSGKTLPDSWDWRGQSEGGPQPGDGLVLPAKDQGTCGSCWTYGTTGTIEGQVAKKTGNLVPLSEQSIMDCAWTKYGNEACNGGNDYVAFWWLLTENGGSVATDASYGGYLNQNSFCHYNNNSRTNPVTGKPVEEGARIKSCMHISEQYKNFTEKTITDSEAVDALSDALYNIGPISVSIDATPHDFYFYRSGYFYNPNCTWNTLDHTVLAVAYKTVDGQR